MMDKEHLDAASEVLAELKQKVLRDEVMERLYQKQLLTSKNKEIAERNLQVKQIEIGATKKLIPELEELIAENT